MAKAKMRTSPGKGSKIDTFFYDVEQVVSTEGEDEGGASQRVLKRKVGIDVFMVKVFDTDTTKPSPASTTSVGFMLCCEETGDEERGTDLNVLLKAMRSKLDERFKIKWKSWLLVKIVRPSMYGEGIGSGLQLTWEDVQRGIAFDGSVLMRRYNRYHDVFSNGWTVSTWPETIKENGRLVAMIEATEANVAALEKATKQIDDLRALLVERVAPAFIEETLRTLSAGGSLLLADN